MKLQIISMICKPKKHIYFQVSWFTVGHNCIGHSLQSDHCSELHRWNVYKTHVNSVLNMTPNICSTIQHHYFAITLIQVQSAQKEKTASHALGCLGQEF